MKKKTKKAVYYQALGKPKSDKSTYGLGFTSDRVAFRKEYVRNGWDKNELMFIKQY